MWETERREAAEHSNPLPAEYEPKLGAGPCPTCGRRAIVMPGDENWKHGFDAGSFAAECAAKDELATVVAERDRLAAAYHEELESMFGEDFADKRIAFLLSDPIWRKKDELSRLRSEVAGLRKPLTELLEAAEDLTRFPQTRRVRNLAKACDAARAALSANRASPEGGSE